MGASGAPFVGAGGATGPAAGTIRVVTVQNSTAASVGTTADGATLAPGDLDQAVADLVEALTAIDDDGWYSTIEVVRPWSSVNPRLTGEFSRTRAIHRYLGRELAALLRAGARITVRP